MPPPNRSRYQDAHRVTAARAPARVYGFDLLSGAAEAAVPGGHNHARGGVIGTKRLSLVVAGLFAAVSRTMACNRNKKISASIVALPRLTPAMG